MSYVNCVTSGSNSALVLLVLNTPYKSHRVLLFCFEDRGERVFFTKSKFVVSVICSEGYLCFVALWRVDNDLGDETYCVRRCGYVPLSNKVLKGRLVISSAHVLRGEWYYRIKGCYCAIFSMFCLISTGFFAGINNGSKISKKAVNSAVMWGGSAVK